jgi:putative hemolysin
MVWIGIALCLLISFVFSGIEAGILSVNRVRLKHRVKLRDRAAIKLNRLLAQPERLLVTVLVVTNLMNIVAVVLTTGELVRALGPSGYLVTFAIFLPVYLFALELLPKSLFRRFPYRALAALAEPLRLADLFLSPMHFVGWRLSRVFIKRRAPEPPKLFAAREDFKYLTIESERTGTLGKAEREMIHNVVDFRGLLAREVMTPIAEVRTIPPAARVPEVLALHRETGIERWPVMEESRISGLVDVFEIALSTRRDVSAGQLQRRVVSVNPEVPAYAVLRRLRAARAHVAVVAGPGGKALGIVSAEALVKRLVSAAAA